MAANPPSLSLHQVNDLVYAVKQADGGWVGNLKRIGAVWKFKAIGIEADGSLVPGGGPFTHRHNATFDSPDETLVSATLTSPSQSPQTHIDPH